MLLSRILYHLLIYRLFPKENNWLLTINKKRLGRTKHSEEKRCKNLLREKHKLNQLSVLL